MTTFDPRPDEATDVHEQVRARYAQAARQALDVTPTAAPGNTTATGGTSGCCGPTTGCGSTGSSGAATSTMPAVDPITRDLYDPDTPFDGALAASLGCGNPTALAQLTPGQDVLDLGSGGGLDVLLSARRIGPDGTAYGLDMTDEMLDLARRHQQEAGVTNARFLKGTIEQVPLPDGSVDVVISNCVINLSPDKDAVLAEAFRVLRPGGRFAVSDIVALRPIPQELRRVVGLWTGCVSGALLDADYVAKLTAAGFTDAGVEVTRRYERDDLVAMADLIDPADLPAGYDLDAAMDALEGAFASAFVRAVKP